ncbi:hypothetical protein HBA93_20530, partial [Ochrobactrum sp. SFR4]|nr:hypothetical protein [Ochrobactrum sp. SFR4]
LPLVLALAVRPAAPTSVQMALPVPRLAGVAAEGLKVSGKLAAAELWMPAGQGAQA